eukprot:TRINITY_DN1237_c0_g1_i1.p1 TRINITY_DN1237_c0_g1~~TRINITY_DN1237_c0_g1_i1.p1  ORF type:complete len:232 (+),score=30.98 TRINITY_DN1237_c0_g1_i1:134-829(+)
MTLFHFINCACLTFLPSLVTYKATQLSEQNSVGLCLYGAGGYLLTQLVKFLVIATFSPSSEITQYDFASELFKGIANVADIYGVLLIMKYARRFNYKILGIGLGWATMDSVAQRLVPLYVDATGMEFSWNNLKMAVDANIQLVMWICFVALVWLSNVKKTIDQNRLYFSVRFVLGIFLLWQPVIGFLQFRKDFDAKFGFPVILLMKFLWACLITFLTWGLYKANEASVQQK